MRIQNKKILIEITNRIIKISLIFSIIVSLLLTWNFIQLKSVAPIENNRVEKLIKKLNENPADIELKQEIRSVDLMARKAFFTSQWHFHIGAYFLMVSIILLLISYTINRSLSVHYLPTSDSNPKTDYWVIKSNERFWLLLTTGIIIVSATVLTFLSDQEYADFKNPTNILVNNKSENIEKNLSEKTIAKNNTDNKNTEDTIATNTTQNSDQEKEKDFPDDKLILKNHPSFRGPFGLGISYATKIPTEWDAASGKNICWKVTVPLPGLNSPVIWDNFIFISGAKSNKRAVYCYDRLSGKLIWSKPVENITGSPTTSPKVTDDTGYSASTLTVDGKRVFAIFSNGDIICFNFNGERLWAKNLGVPSNHYGHSSSLLFYQNKLIIQYDNSKSRNLIALSTHTGDIKWNTTRPGKISWSSPIIVKNNGRTEIIVNNEPFVASYDPSSGKELWKIDCLSGEIGASPAYSNGIVFAANAYAKLTAIKIGLNPTILWENNDYLPDVSSPVAYNGLLFITSSSGEIAAYNISDGNLLWNHEFDNVFYASPMVADGKIYLIDRNGIMHIMKADKKFELISEPKINEKSDCTPAFTDGKIYIRGQKNLYCIGSK